MTSSSGSFESMVRMHVPERRQRLPIGVRSLGYVMFFLVALFGGGAWLMYQVDARFPDIHHEFGIWRDVGKVVFVTALTMFLGCTWVLMRRGEGAIAEFDPPNRLVQVGPYRWVRNPITLCVAFMLLGEALALSSTGMLLGLFLAAVMAKLQSRMEERLLLGRFGDEYLRYCYRVPRWIPHWPTDAPTYIESPRGPWKSSP